MSYELKYHRGDKVKNLIEGWEGIVVGYSIPSDGMVMYTCAVPKTESKADYAGETMNITCDDASFVLVEAIASDDPFYAEFPTDHKFVIGDRVNNLVEPEIGSGCIIGINVFNNLCVYYQVSTDKANNDGKRQSRLYSESVLEKVEDSKLSDPQTVKKAVRKTRGGPSYIADDLMRTRYE